MFILNNIKLGIREKVLNLVYMPGPKDESYDNI